MVAGSLLAGPVGASGAAAAVPAAGNGSAAGGRIAASSVCPKPKAANAMRCFAVARPGGRRADGLPQGYGPAELAAAYKLPRDAGAGQTIAIVDAFNDPHAASDLAVYRRTFGLPACTAGNGCFRQVNQAGKAAPLPPADPGWAVEESLDLDMVSAACPECHILLVEGASNFGNALGVAEDTAVRLGADVVSNSYGQQESGAMLPMEKYYRHRGVAITVASGDFGFGPANFPAVLSNVIAVGGTSLYRAHNGRGWREAVWSNEFGAAASGCSAYIPKPVWQHDPHCLMRTVADVAADADPATGPAVYDTFQTLQVGLPSGWSVVGGTSASAPFIAGVIGLAGNGRSLYPGRPYYHQQDLFDAVGGSTGYCGGDYLCTGLRGYDAPSGWGTPDGTGAF